MLVDLTRRMSAALIVGAVVGACSSSDGGMEPPPEDPRPAQVQTVSGDAQSATVGQALPDPVVAQVNDQFGDPMPGVTLDFAVTVGGGVVSAASVTTDAGGQASVEWTLGTAAGDQELTATVSGMSLTATFTATGLPDDPAAATEESGNDQVAPQGATLQEPLVVQVVDQFGNGVSGVPVAFEVLTGGGTVDPALVDTDAEGLASTTWTLGDVEGTQTAQGVVDALQAAIPFEAQAVNFSVNAVAPDTLVEGQAGTITGEGFDDQDIANNTVTVDGVAAIVTAATPTEITFTVPAFDCRPVRVAGVAVGRDGFELPPVDHPVRADDLLDLAVGEYRLIEDPSAFCFQFGASDTGDDAYVLGVGSVAETPTVFMNYRMTGEAGLAASAGGPQVAARPHPVFRGGGMPFGDMERLAERREHYRAEMALRAKERALWPTLLANAASAAPAPRVAQEVPAVGETLTFNVPDIDGNICTQFTEIEAVVKVVGETGIFVTDVDNPSADSLTTAELQAASDTFDLFIFAGDTAYFGAPTDLDDNDRIVVILTVKVNEMAGGGVAGFVVSTDLAPGCASGNNGEIFYSHVPDPNNTAGTRAREKDNILAQMPSLIAHELTHIIQFSRRIQANGVFGSTWELEGQATLAEEVVGHRVLGNTTGQDFGADVAIQGEGERWYEGAFVQLAFYYGWAPSEDLDARNEGAPEECTLFGNFDINQSTTCEPFWFYGASWSFQRYVSDRFGPSYHADGERQLHKDWIGANPDLEGVENVEALLGVELDTLFAKWAAMHWADGRVAGIDATLEMTSWNMFDIFQAAREATRLTPTEQTFASFTESKDARGGSVGYTRLSSSGARPALAVKVRTTTGGILDVNRQPQFWIVRER